MAGKSQLDKPTKTLEELAADVNAAALASATSDKEYIPDLTDDQLRKLSRDKLSMAIQAIDPVLHPEMTRKLCAELLDRLDGKPAQSVQLDATIRKVTVDATINYIMPPKVDNKIIDHVDNTQPIDYKQ